MKQRLLLPRHGRITAVLPLLSIIASLVVTEVNSFVLPSLHPIGASWRQISPPSPLHYSEQARASSLSPFTTSNTKAVEISWHSTHHLHRLAPLNMAPPDNDKDKEVANDYSWLGVLWLPLWLVYISNQWSRSSLYYLVDFSSSANPLVAMNVDLQFTEAQYGVLASVAFTSLYAIATVLAGYISDRYNRKTLTILSVGAWTLATLATAVSTDYTQVLLARIAMGLACAFSTPIGYTLLQQSLPSTQQSFGTGLYGTGVAFGGALGALSLLLDQNYGWRQALFIISGFGAVAAVLSTVLLPDDPKVKALAPAIPEKKGATTSAIKKSDDGSEEVFFASFTKDIGQVLSTRRVQWLFLASLLRFSSGLCIGVWSAPFFREAFPDHAGDYSVIQALITAVAGTLSGLGGGLLADKLSASAPTTTTGTTITPALDFLNVDSVGRRLYVPVVGSLLAAPAWYWAISQGGSDNLGGGFEWAMIWLSLEYLVAECWFGPTISTLQATVGPRIGGTAQGLFTLTGAIANLAPTALGVVYGNYLNSVQQQGTTTPGTEELSHLLAIAVCFGYISSAFCFAMSAQSPPTDSNLRLDSKQQ